MTFKDQSETVTRSPISDDAASVPADLSAPTITIDQGEGSVSLNKTSLAPLPSLIGVTLDSRYFIQKELGQGGVGAVYLAQDRKLHDKAVVIKVLLEKSLQNSWVVQKFQQEKEALARVDHPGVVGILDAGELPDGKPYLVMQFIDGVTLRSEIKPEGINLERGAQLIRQIGRALSAAHEKGIFHRDLKPENIMLQSYGGGEEQVKIIDFGIAKLKDSSVAPSTVTGATAGTVSYMAPEQLSGRPVSAAMDIYALGTIAYELVTGRRPFNPETGFELLEMQRAGVRVPPSDLRPSLSAKAEEIILRALSFEPGNRPARARDFGDELALALHHGITSEGSPRQTSEPLPTRPAREETPLARKIDVRSSKTIAASFPILQSSRSSQEDAASASRVSPQRRPALWAGLALLIFLAAGTVVWYLARGGKTFDNAASLNAVMRNLNYSLTVQKMRDGKPYQDPFESSGQEIFENSWKFRMNLTSPQAGYLYLLNEGPSTGGSTTFNVLFPAPSHNSGNAYVNANEDNKTGWMVFDEHQGTEKFWIIWCVSPVKELEAVKDAVNAENKGEIKDSAQTRAVHDFLEKHSSPKPEVARDSAKKQTTVKGKGDVLVYYAELEHH